MVRRELKQKERHPDSDAHRELINLKTVAVLVDAHRSSVRRWLRDAGVRPVAVGRGRNGAIRYRWRDIRQWLDSLDIAD